MGKVNLYDTREVAEMLSVRDQYVRNLIATGELKAFKLPAPGKPVTKKSRWRITETSLLEYLSSIGASLTPVSLKGPTKADLADSERTLARLGVTPIPLNERAVSLYTN